MVNQGQVKYETVSERLGEKSGRIILAKLEDWKRDGGEGVTEAETMTLLAGALMVVQFKVSGTSINKLTVDLPRRCVGLYRLPRPPATPLRFSISGQ